MKKSNLPTALHRVADYPLVEALANRRSRRFAMGMEITHGPLRFRSKLAPVSLTPDEEELLLFAGIGDTGNNIGDMAFDERTNHEKGEGNSEGRTLMNLHGRTTPSACGAHTTQVFFTNDSGIYFNANHLEQPSNNPPVGIVKVSENRLEIPRSLPFMHAFNQAFSNVAGSTYFIPVTSVVPIYLNLLLLLLGEEYGYFIIDTENDSEPCGLSAFGRSCGGHLHDRPEDGRTSGAADHL